MSIMFNLKVKLGWRGKDCKACNFTEAAHQDKTLQWHPDNSPCGNFKKKEWNDVKLA